MTVPSPEIDQQGQAASKTEPSAGSLVAPAQPKAGFGAARSLALPFATCVALLVHLALSGKELAVPARSFSIFLGTVLSLSVAGASVQPFWKSLRRWVAHFYPIVAAAMLLVCVWEVITTGLRWLPMPYFPGPARVLQSLLDDRLVLLDSAWHSLLLLLAGYAIGVAVAFLTGLLIGWFAQARYWGMPILKIIGPIPATAWIPLAMVLSPSAVWSAIGVIALAVWFPVTMLTASGISNTRASYLDVARTLGARPAYLIFHVAIPAAMPNIFVGLFMGLGASFLTLVVAETVGVKSGLGWYVAWAQGWAEYGKVYAALLIMAAFFSTIMTLLFKARDRMLVWQKGLIKW